MFVTPNAFVLGAGGSVQYSYPLGGGLVSRTDREFVSQG